MNETKDRPDVRLCSEFAVRVDQELGARKDAGKAAFDVLDLEAVERLKAEAAQLLTLRQHLLAYLPDGQLGEDPPKDVQPTEPELETHASEPEPEPEPEPAVADAAPEPAGPAIERAAVEPAPEPPQVQVDAPVPSTPSSGYKAPARKNIAPEPLDNKTIGEAREMFLGRCKDLDAIRPNGKAETAGLQGVVCLGRCALAGEKSPDMADAIRDELARICAKWNEWELGEFFAFSSQRDHSPRTWYDLAGAYALLGQAQRCAASLEDEPPADETARNELLKQAGAVQALVYLRLQSLIPPAIDAANMELYRRLAGMAKDWGVYVPYWAPDASIDEVAAEALDLLASVQRLDARTRKEKAIQAVNGAVARISRGDDPEKAINEAATLALASGIPPSDKNLRCLLAAYVGLIHQDVSKHHARLCEYIHKDLTVNAAHGKSPAPPNEMPEDQAHLDRLAKLRELVQGKTMVWLGGNKGQSKRKDDIKKLLGLKEFLWPDMEEGTNPDRMASEVAKGDFVCLVVRFSRHSYKDVLDDAKAQGKRVANLPAGLGIPRVVYDMYNQWLNGNGHASGVA